MNTMFYTKILGGVCGSLLILLLVKWGAEAYYMPAPAHGEHAEAAYAVEAEDDGQTEVEEEIPFADLLAAADLRAGERKFGKCSACHKVGENEHAAGPTLFGIVGRAQGSTDFGKYSGSLPSGTWTTDALNEFLESPRSYAPGTTMGFQGFSKETDRANVIAYLSTL